MRLAVICILLLHYLPDVTPKRIVSGREADISEFPYQVSLELHGIHTCGAAIISEYHILTAGHCVHTVDVDPFKLPELAVRVGTSVSNMNQGETYNVSRVIKHPDYRDDPVTNDIALVRVARPIAFSERVKPIRLAQVPPSVGDIAWVTGYGLTNIPIMPPPEQQQTEIEDVSAPRELRVVRLPIVSIDRCRRQLAARGGVVTPGMICAGYSRGHRDACKGDSGGPLVIGDRLVGITSWGIGCGEEGLPGVYTDVAEYASFVQTATQEMDSTYDTAVTPSLYPVYYPFYYRRHFHVPCETQ